MRDIFGELIRCIEHLELTGQRAGSAAEQHHPRRRGDGRLSGEGLARVDAHGVVTKKVPWLERSGSIRQWTPPAEGRACRSPIADR